MIDVVAIDEAKANLEGFINWFVSLTEEDRRSILAQLSAAHEILKLRDAGELDVIFNREDEDGLS